eukprot:gene6314-7037_t
MAGYIQIIFVIFLAICLFAQAKPTTKSDQGPKQCKEPIGIQTGFLEDRDVKTSSAAKNFTIHDAWCAATNNDKQFFAFDLGEDFLFSKIATQGKVDDKNRFVKSYVLQFSNDNKKWTPYLDSGKQVLEGNKDTFTVKYHNLEPETVGRYVKIQPKTWNNGICSRVELYGCSVEDFEKEKGKGKSKIPESKSEPPAAAVPEIPTAVAAMEAASENDAPKQDAVPAAATGAAKATDASKQDSEATWKFLTGADNGGASSVETNNKSSSAASDNADLLELTQQLGATAP